MSADWTWIDWLGALLVVGLAVRGFLRGAWWQLVRLLGITAALALTRAIAPMVSPAVHERFSQASERAVNGWVWCLSILIALFVVALLARPSAKDGAGEDAGFLNRAGGGLLGALSGLLLYAGLLVCLCQIAAPEWTTRVIGRSHSRELIAGLERVLPTFLDVHAADAVHDLDRH